MKPLKGIKVIELSTYVAAPTAVRMLADWGANVVKVEDFQGDPARYLGNVMRVPANEKENPLWEVHNANKTGIALNLKTEEGIKIMNRLLKDADIFVTNIRPASLEKMGLSYDEVSKKHPKLIYAILTGYGEKGEDSSRPGYDTVAYFARTGGITPPYMPVPAQGDNITGMALASGICAALVKQQLSGKGEKVSASLLGTSIWVNGWPLTMTQEQYTHSRSFNFPLTKEQSPAIATMYECKDGRFIYLCALNYAKDFPNICRALDIENCINDERFTMEKAFSQNIGLLRDVFDEGFREFDSDEMTKRLEENDVPYGRIKEFKDIYKDEQAWSNDYLYEHSYVNGNKSALPNTPIQFSGFNKTEHNNAPLHGEHTEQVLLDCGYKAKDIEKLVSDKIIKIR